MPLGEYHVFSVSVLPAPLSGQDTPWIYPGANGRSRRDFLPMVSIHRAWNPYSRKPCYAPAYPVFRAGLGRISELPQFTRNQIKSARGFLCCGHSYFLYIISLMLGIAPCNDCKSIAQPAKIRIATRIQPIQIFL